MTVQDHPCQAKHLDAWTLLPVIAADQCRSGRANVANLPLRSPVVLARSVATLDRLTAREAVDALIEAIAVIRGVLGHRHGVRR